MVISTLTGGYTIAISIDTTCITLVARPHESLSMYPSTAKPFSLVVLNAVAVGHHHDVGSS